MEDKIFSLPLGIIGDDGVTRSIYKKTNSGTVDHIEKLCIRFTLNKSTTSSKVSLKELCGKEIEEQGGTIVLGNKTIRVNDIFDSKGNKAATFDFNSEKREVAINTYKDGNIQHVLKLSQSVGEQTYISEFSPTGRKLASFKINHTNCYERDLNIPICANDTQIFKLKVNTNLTDQKCRPGEFRFVPFNKIENQGSKSSSGR